jgi:hypothetical protein
LFASRLHNLPASALEFAIVDEFRGIRISTIPECALETIAEHSLSHSRIPLPARTI